jgi:hypothetical protein
VNFDTLILRSLEEWSAEATVPTGLAERALRRRTRRRVRAGTLVTAVAALVVAIGVTADVVGGPASRPTRPPTPADTTLHADPMHSPPVRFVAAGRVAMSAYYVTRHVKTGGSTVLQRTWYLYDRRAGSYRQTPWADLDVAPGLHQAAVLEGPLPSGRVGLFDMRTQRVTRWIALDHPAGGLAWSPDGTRLLVTTYDRSPDTPAAPGSSSRTGFYLVDGKAGRTLFFRPFPADTLRIPIRQDVGWSRDGRLIFSPTDTVPTKRFYDLQGRPRPAPAHEADSDQKAGLSPDGRYIAGGNPGPGPGPLTAVTDATTGRTVGTQPVEQLTAWADAEHLIAVACEPDGCMGKGEFYNRLVLVSVDGKKITPLTGYRHTDRNGAWEPLLTLR